MPELAFECVRIEEATSVSAELAGAVRRIIGQLSASAPVPTEGELREVVDSPATRLLLARDEHNNIVGSLTLALFRVPTGLRACIEDVVVDEGVRGQGVGEGLTKEALRLAKSAGARTVDLTSRPEREAVRVRPDRFRPLLGTRNGL